MQKIKYPLLVMAFFWIIGLLIGTSFDFNFYVLLVGFIFAFLTSVIFYFQKRKAWFLLLVIAILLLAFGRMDYYQSNHQTVLNEELLNIEQEVGIRGYISSNPMTDGDLVKFSVEVVSYNIDGQEVATNYKEDVLIYLYLNTESEQKLVSNWESGLGIKLAGELTKPSEARNPGQFDYQKYLMNKGIYWIVKVDGISGVDLSDGSRYNNSLNSLSRFLEKEIEGLYPDPQEGFMKALIIGNKNSLSNEIEEDFSILGLSHLLAISGLHLSILTMMFYWALTKIGITREKTVHFITGVLIVYMLLTGSSASIVRATIMTLIMLYSFNFKRPIDGLQSIGIALILMTIYQPMWIFDVGFQLSFTVTFFILWGYKYVYHLLPIKEGFIKNSLTLLMITQLASFPLSFYYFNHYSLLSIIFNLLVVPLFSFILPVGIISLLFGSLNLYVGNLLAYIQSEFLELLFAIIHKGTKFTYFNFYGSFDSFLLVILIFIIIFWLLYRSDFKNSLLPLMIKKRIYIFEKIILITIIFTLLISVITQSEQGAITFIDVGQGDSILVEAPSGYNILIDSGGKVDFPKEEWQKRKNPFDVGKDIILPYLQYKGSSKIDMAVLTHEDMDHLGGYLSLIDYIDIGIFVVPAGFPRTDAGNMLEQELRKKEIEIVNIDKIKKVQLDKNTSLTFFPIEIESSTLENDHTLVTQLYMYNTSVFFSADLEAAGEEILFTTYNFNEVDILKVGHHGSETSTTDLLINTIEPNDAIISVGENNHYGHPNEDVIQRLVNSGSKIWRTDNDGAIVVNVLKDSYEINKTINNK